MTRLPGSGRLALLSALLLPGQTSGRDTHPVYRRTPAFC
jgi:hypothetical protein